MYSQYLKNAFRRELLQVPFIFFKEMSLSSLLERLRGNQLRGEQLLAFLTAPSEEPAPKCDSRSSNIFLFYPSTVLGSVTMTVCLSTQTEVGRHPMVRVFRSPVWLISLLACMTAEK